MTEGLCNETLASGVVVSESCIYFLSFQLYCVRCCIFFRGG